MRRIVSITGSRADYGPMEPVYRAITADPQFELHLAVMGLHFLPEFASSLAQLREDGFGIRHELPLAARGDDGAEMAQAIAQYLTGIVGLLRSVAPDIVLLQGDRGEMLAAAIAAAHMNIAIVHMSGGDVSGSIDDSVRHAISKFAHFHLPNCEASRQKLIAMGESTERILVVGEPGLDQLVTLDFVPRAQLEKELRLPAGEPYLVATLHPVTDEADDAERQMDLVLDALEDLNMPVVFTHPNNDAGGQAMRGVLQSREGRPFLRIVANLGSRRYLSLVRWASAVVGNSSSGIFDTPTLRVPTVNIGSRQTGRTRADNVIDVGFDRREIADAVRHVLSDRDFRAVLENCRNPFGDGKAAMRVCQVLKELELGPGLIAKWRPAPRPFLPKSVRGL